MEGWTYNMSHERVSTLFPSPVQYPASPFFETACPSYASEGVSFTVSRSSSFACVFLQHEVLVNRPQLPLSSRSVERNHYNLPAELVSPSTSIRDSLRSRDNIFEIYLYLREKSSFLWCSYMTLLLRCSYMTHLHTNYFIRKDNNKRFL